MSAFITAMTGAATAVGLGTVGFARAWPLSTGRHRARQPQPQPQPLVRPIEALDKTAALCATERRVTLHARTHITRQFICMDCRNPSPDPTATTGES